MLTVVLSRPLADFAVRRRILCMQMSASDMCDELRLEHRSCAGQMVLGSWVALEMETRDIL